MEVETSLSWRGPYWYAGRRPLRSATADMPEDLDVSLLKMFARDSKLPTALPAAIVVDVTSIEESDRDSFFNWLKNQVQALPCHVPFYILTGAADHIPSPIKTAIIIDRSVPDDVLLMLICIHQRALLRNEEAQIRRKVFGRIRDFGSAPHHSGISSLIVVGLSNRYLEWQDASNHKVDVVGAFDGNLAVEFMSQRAFDAVVIDADYDNAVEYMQQIRRDPRFAGLPVLAVCENALDASDLFRHGASDVLLGENLKDTLEMRLGAAIRFGKRRRLTDRILSESRVWLRQQFNTGGLEIDDYTNYLETCSDALAAKGLDLWEVRLQPENFGLPDPADEEELLEMNGTLLSIADATSRDEDLVCYVRGIGPVAVMKNETGTLKLQKRITSILSNTTL